ncbi:MAG TPA: undecaprenyldiphospho-muramoylpentapeptide beta-N-acetylglucosaminyltransferase [Methylococcaceae bacterium]|jgi:UDP-N-acetylglucosamine--N-acetylmuramyl-(pentapeptide) pyrophosphoryl-undecaprenol N-acetylglucosamine transferase|nr:undecaprenyldiphospho-muramoylpentapeptide beta-N-acetylglucosaminyltransferase [Methylococcaceae bacterium]HIB62070.1 undecaprenyldiphospho-muramoylpentapeptide beta-N-acetylglucosaminyltransferase [Methylococcaceae bacterium]HIN69484.1 undecaprenyldiphospho-muramoylpentapeptide beta-N-acetylglucosaminyltransferase [Methylococcales bacterium]
MDKRIVIMAGGTGGHVYPALAVALYLQKDNWQVTWLGTRVGIESRVVPENNIDIDFVSVTGIRGKDFRGRLAVPGMLLKSMLQVFGILRRRRPNVILGLGGFVAGPGGVVAKVLGIPLVIHEQNRIPGTTNRILAKWADRVLQGFPDSFPVAIGAEYVGNPLRPAIEVFKPKRIIQQQSLNILVLGGSLGARKLNEIVPAMIAMVKPVNVVHQTGSVMVEKVKALYTSQQKPAEVVAFIDDMAVVYSWADLIICRSGAMTVSEIAAVGLPSIMIPFPFAIDDHQTANAQYLADVNASILIAQSELNAKRLAKEIMRFINEPSLLLQMGKAARQCAQVDATKAVAKVCIDVVSI